MAYRGTEAYDFSLFEPQVIEQPNRQQPRSAVKQRNASPARKAPVKRETPAKKQMPVKRREPIAHNVIELVDNHQVSIERHAETKVIPLSAKKAMCFFVVCLCLLAVNLVLQTRYDTISNEITSIQSEIDIVEGENVRLNAELSSKISSDRIENYAENVLGMVKAENYQISYIDLSHGDEIVVSGDKSVGDSEFTGKLKELIAYIF